MNASLEAQHSVHMIISISIQTKGQVILGYRDHYHLNFLMYRISHDFSHWKCWWLQWCLADGVASQSSSRRDARWKKPWWPYCSVSTKKISAGKVGNNQVGNNRSDLWKPNPLFPALRILASATYCADTTVFVHPVTPRRAKKLFCPHNESASPRTVMEGVGGEGDHRG